MAVRPAQAEMLRPSYCSFCLEECDPVIVLAMVCCPDCAGAGPKERQRRALKRWSQR